MNCKIADSNGVTYIECLPGDMPFASESDALEAVVFCHENHANLLLLFAEYMSDDFFELRTGVAGAITQKLVNHGIKTAVVVSDELANQGRFKDMISEANRGSHFRTFPNRVDAE